jgi:hypothetical protein
MREGKYANLFNKRISRRRFVKGAGVFGLGALGGWRRFLYEPDGAFGYNPMSEALNSLIYPTSVTVNGETVQIDTTESRFTPPEVTYLQAILQEYTSSPSTYIPQDISFALAQDLRGTKGMNQKAHRIVHGFGLPVAKQIRRESFGLASASVLQRVLLGSSYGGFAFVRPAHLLGYTHTDPSSNQYTLVGNSPVNRDTLTQKTLDSLTSPGAPYLQKLGLFLNGLLSTRPYTVDEGFYRRDTLLNTTASYLLPSMPGYEEIFSLQDGNVDLNRIVGYRGVRWEEAGIGADIDPTNHHGFELGLRNAIEALFPYLLSQTSIIHVPGISYLDGSGSSNSHPELDVDRWYYNAGWVCRDGCPVVTSLYSTPTPNLPIHYAFLDDLRKSEFVL